MFVFGLVESTGPGHAVPVQPANDCAGLKRPDKPANATACVEVWAGKDLVIDGSVGNNGEINADRAQSGGRQVAWIDLFALGNITIYGEGAGPYPANAHPYAVHANEFTGNSTGGLIAVVRARVRQHDRVGADSRRQRVVLSRMPVVSDRRGPRGPLRGFIPAKTPRHFDRPSRKSPSVA